MKPINPTGYRTGGKTLREELFQGGHLAVADTWLGNRTVAALWGEGQDACSETVVCTGVYRCVQVCGGQAESGNKLLGELLLDRKSVV